MKGGKGVVEIGLVALVAAIGFVLFLAGPNIGKGINNIFAGTKNQQKATHKVTEQYSMFYKDDKGNYKPAPVPYKKTEESLNMVNTEPPETLWQKFLKLGAMAIAIIVVLSYLGIWPIIVLWWKKKIKPKLDQAQADLEAAQTEKKQLRGDAKLIVQSVDEGLASMDEAIKTANALVNASTDIKIKETQLAVAQALSKAKDDFLTAMSRKQDTTTKNLVRELLKND